MSRKVRHPKGRREDAAPILVHYLLWGDRAAAKQAYPDGDAFDLFQFSAERSVRAALWHELRDELLPDWVLEHAGTRPHAWWEFDAPPWTEDVPARVRPLVALPDVWHLRQPRRRVGGRGSECYLGLNIAPEFRFGLPQHFIDAWQVQYYTGRATDIDGRPIGQEFAGHSFPYEAYDASRPPTYESEAAFLRRHGLFLPGEEARLPADAFEPELVVFDEAIEP